MFFGGSVTGVLRLASKFSRRAWMEAMQTRRAERESLPLGVLILASCFAFLRRWYNFVYHDSDHGKEFIRPQKEEVTKQA